MDLIVVGLGYVGLPLAYEASLAGMEVLGLEIESGVVTGLNNGKSHVDDISDADVRSMLDNGFLASLDPAAVQKAEVVVLCVPTPIEDGRRPRPHGGRRGRLLNRTMAVAGDSRGLGVHYLSRNDQRDYPADDRVRLRTRGRGIGFPRLFARAHRSRQQTVWAEKHTESGWRRDSGMCQRARQFYERVVDEIVVAKGTREAEAAKLLENTYRHVNIALVNEMARFFHELDVDFWDVIRLASTKPFGFQAFYPGPGVGGHCIPIDPNYLSYRVRTQLGYGFRFVELAQEINAMMPAYVVTRVQECLNARSIALRGSTMLLLGVTYKPNISDQRESPAVAVAKSLRSQGASVLYHDPFIADWDVEGVMKASADVYGAARSVDITVLLQAHDQYDADAIADVTADFFDTRGVLKSGKGTRL